MPPINILEGYVMKIYWREAKRGQRLILDAEDGEHQEEIGGVRETKRGFDAFAKTFGYDPGRAEKGIGTMDDAKQFVESFKPWELYQGAEELTVDPELQPAAE